MPFRILLVVVCLFSSNTLSGMAAEQEQTKAQIMIQRMDLYTQYEHLLVPWYYLAAIDQYERNIQAVRPDIPKRDGVLAIQFSKEYWAGELNPWSEDSAPSSISYFGGFGVDGNGDGLADIAQDEDIALSMLNFLSSFGTIEDDYKLALWAYYKNEEAVRQIFTIATLFKHFKTIDLNQHAFPLSVNYNYSYRGTWGANRGWGGRRIHEGTDLFANYGTQVLSTSYGVVEQLGWNEFGGWRIGIRDHHNTYHYYAHLNNYHDNMKIGDIVEPGMIIGYVGSSGYGKEGTAGKFPPHLHYGMYKFNGRTEWAFDPYPSLQLWERESKKAKNK